MIEIFVGVVIGWMVCSSLKDEPEESLLWEGKQPHTNPPTHRTRAIIKKPRKNTRSISKPKPR